MINIAKLLKDAPKGMKLYSPLLGEVEFAEVMDTDYMPIRVIKRGYGLRFDKYGRYMGNEYPDAECVLFPSKDCRTWEGWTFEPTFKVGDWIVKKNGNTFYGGNYAEQITLIEVDEKGKYIWLPSKTWVSDDVIRPWTIADARDGDVLSIDFNGFQKIVIFKSLSNKGVEGYGITAFKDRVDFPTSYGKEYYSKTWTKTLTPATKEQRIRLFTELEKAGYKWDADKKELHKIIEPIFKVGDWIAYNENKSSITPIQIIRITEDKYVVSGHWSYDFRTLEADWHLWSIADTKDGDVLCTYECGEPKIVFIHKLIRKNGSNIFMYYCYYNIMHPRFDANNEPGCLAPKREDVKPATKEQCDLLFAKMREAGYEWDADKKELRKIQHYDVSNFHAGMPVLVRDGDCGEWKYVSFSHYRKVGTPFCAGGQHWFQCIPFNEKTEHLLGTTDMCPEEYINW